MRERERESEVMKDSDSKVGFLPTTQPLLIASTINWKLKTTDGGQVELQNQIHVISY